MVKRKRHNPEQIVLKLQEAAPLLKEEKTVAQVIQQWESMRFRFY